MTAPKIEVETWENASRGIVWVKKLDRMGNLKDEVIRAGMKVVLSTEERMFNQDSAATEDLDVFKNGRLIPVRLIETAEDAKEIAANPNLISESEMRGLFKAHHKTFEAKVNSITNVVALERMSAMAEEENASLRQVNLLQARMSDLAAKTTNVPVVERSSSPLGGDRFDAGRPVGS